VLNPNSGDALLVAWVEARGDEGHSAKELREFLAARVPAHMIPSQIAYVEKMPNTPSGKIDR
jgi:acyl-CoA synthetase (AMP-forming)/AMP-acid ligase II